MAATLGSRVIGVCDSPVGLIRRACAAAGVDPGPSLGAVTDLVDADYLGINHLGWLRGLRVAGADLLPDLLDSPERLLLTEEGRSSGRTCCGRWGRCRTSTCTGTTPAARRCGTCWPPGGPAASTCGSGSWRSTRPLPGLRLDAARLWREANDERNRSYFAELRTGEHAGERDEADVAAGGYESVALALAAALCGGPPARLILTCRTRARFRRCRRRQ